MSTLHINTPLIESLAIGRGVSSRVWLKLDALQPCGSFKARGVGHACQVHIDNGATSFVSSSGGNAGLAVAYSGRRLDVPVTVVVPLSTKKRAINLIEAEGAEVLVHGHDWAAAHAQAQLLARCGAVLIHPFDDPLLWSGHATVIDEIVQSGLRPEGIVLSVGGGGLLCGAVEGLLRNGLSDVPVLAVETEGAGSFATAYSAREHIGISGINSIATSLGANKVAERAFDLIEQHPISSHTVTDREAVAGCNRLLEEHRVMVEPACGASIAAVESGAAFFADKQDIVVIVCGGVGVTSQLLAEWQSI